MLTTRSIKYLGLFIACLIIGLLLGNRIILVMSLIPLSLILTGYIAVPPGNFRLKSRLLTSQVWVGDTLEVKYEVSVGSGFGVFVLHQDLPPHFMLSEGNNLRVLWKGWRAQSYIFSYKLLCTKRGTYTILPLKWESNHFLRLLSTREDELGDPFELTVRPKLLNIHRIRGIPGIAASPFPVIDMAKIGVATTDFREIRRYVYGDPVKNINWKATARVTRPDAWPLTNEYEVEGKKSVWVFLDASKILEVGNDIENVFEYCLEAANGIIYFYLNGGYRVGLYVFNGNGQLFYPDAGMKQFFKISRELIDLKSGNKVDDFPLAVEKCRSYLLGYNPLCVIITRLDSRYSDSIIQGVRGLRQMRGRRTGKLPVMVINVAGYHIVSYNKTYDANTAVLMRLNTRPRMQQIRRLGGSVLDWNPRKESFGAALLKLVKTK
jgi:uncharacterized protein (DUF58 family)